jgi:hypothetical protein
VKKRSPKAEEWISSNDEIQELRYFAAPDDKAGTGVIFFEGCLAWATPCPEAAWPSLRKGNWRIKPLGEDGKPTPLFLLARAYVITVHAKEKRRLRLEPVDCPRDATEAHRKKAAALAWSQMREDTKADAWAREARLMAVTSCQLVMDDNASDLVGRNESYIEWFKSFRRGLKSTEPETFEVMSRYISDLVGCLAPRLRQLEAAEKTQLIEGKYLEPPSSSPDVATEIHVLCETIGRLATKHGKPPTKAQVRHALQGHPIFKLHDLSSATNRFGELLEMVGFQWLPNGKAGRPRKSVQKESR